MATNISSLDLSARIGPYKYIFILLHGDPFISAVREELAKQFAPFGEALGEKGAVFAPFESKVASTNEEFYDKTWPEEIESEIEHRLLSGDGGDPAMLVINTDFVNFNPMADPWRIIWLSDYQDSPQDIVRLFRLLATAANRDEDVMDYLGSLSRRRGLSKLSKVVDIKPGIFGVSIDLKALLSQALALRD